MTDWLLALADLARRGVPGILVTVAAVEGSAPRETGARMMVTERELHGSIGGGRLEHAAIQQARAMLDAEDAVVVRRVALGPHLGQCCGGRVRLLFEPVRDAAWLAAVEDHARAGRACVVATVLDPGGAERPPLGAKLVLTEAGTVDGWGEPVLEAEVIRAARRVLGSGQGATTIDTCGRVILLDPVVREAPIVVFGAGHVGRALASILGALPCRVLWIDGRAEEFPRIVAANITVEVSDTPELEAAAAPPGSSFVVMTHSHQIDFAVTERILRRGDFAYFGLIGSLTKRRRFERRLQLRGIDAEVLARMRCPVGIPGVRGKHPGEIAVAVAAELLQVRGRVTAIGVPSTEPSAGSGAARAGRPCRI